MQDEIDKWLEVYGNDTAYAEPVFFIRRLREESAGWQKQAGANLRIAAEQMRALANQFDPNPEPSTTQVAPR